MTKAEFIQVGGGRVSLSRLIKVGGGRVSLTSYVLLWSFTQWKLR